MAVHTHAFVIVRQVLGLICPGRHRTPKTSRSLSFATSCWMEPDAEGLAPMVTPGPVPTFREGVAKRG